MKRSWKVVWIWPFQQIPAMSCNSKKEALEWQEFYFRYYGQNVCKVIEVEEDC